MALRSPGQPGRRRSTNLSDQRQRRGKRPNDGGFSSTSRVVGSFLRSVREGQNLSQDQVAALSGGGAWRLSRSAISAIERGRNLPSLEALIALSRVLHIDPLEVIERAELGPQHMPPDIANLTVDELDKRAYDLFWEGEHREGLVIYDAMLDQLTLDPPEDPAAVVRLQAKVELKRSSALRRCGALLAARAAVERSISLAKDLPEVQAQAYTMLSTLYAQMDHISLAEDTSARAVALAAECGDRIHGRSLINQGLVLIQSGSHESARQVLVKARDLVVRSGDDRHMPHVEGHLGICWLKLGKPRQASEHIGRAVKIAHRARLPALEATWLVDLGRIALAEQDYDNAERYATRALRIATAGEQWLTIFRAEWLRHCIRRQLKPSDPDRTRIGYLKKLLSRLEEHRSQEAVQEFKAEVFGTHDRRRTS